ncbi:hypothetical protein LEMLEM_LOCUS364 [Lemmus lemmus]
MLLIRVKTPLSHLDVPPSGQGFI